MERLIGFALVAAGLYVASMIGGCATGDAFEAAPYCAQGEKVDCDCGSYWAKGWRTCTDDGSAFGACVCPAEAGPPCEVLDVGTSAGQCSGGPTYVSCPRPVPDGCMDNFGIPGTFCCVK